MLKKTVIWSVAALVAIQFIEVDKSNPKVESEIALQAPQKVMSILKKSCYDCHSNETKWPHYSNIAPISFVVASHVKDARAALNFSEYEKIDKERKVARLKRAIVTVKNERMALPSYVMAHQEAKLSQDEKVVLVKWFEKELESLESKR